MLISGNGGGGLLTLFFWFFFISLLDSKLELEVAKRLHTLLTLFEAHTASSEVLPMRLLPNKLPSDVISQLIDEGSAFPRRFCNS